MVKVLNTMACVPIISKDSKRMKTYFYSYESKLFMFIYYFAKMKRERKTRKRNIHLKIWEEKKKHDSLLLYAENGYSMFQNCRHNFYEKQCVKLPFTYGFDQTYNMYWTRNRNRPISRILATLGLVARTRSEYTSNFSFFRFLHVLHTQKESVFSSLGCHLCVLLLLKITRGQWT